MKKINSKTRFFVGIIGTYDFLVGIFPLFLLSRGGRA